LHKVKRGFITSFPQNMPTLSIFPSEIIIQIIENIDDHCDLFACSLVNTKLHAVANPLLWRSIFIRDQAQGIRFLYQLVMASSQPVGQWIRQVNLQNFNLSDRALMILMRRTPHLESLIIDDARRITDTSLQHIYHYWPNLNTLHLTGSPISQVSFRVLGQCSNLTSLELLGCPGLQPDTFSVNFIDSPLEKLKIATWIDDNQEENDDHDLDEPWLANATTIDLTGLRRLTHLTIVEPPFGMLHLGAMTATAADHDFCWRAMTSLSIEGCFDSVDQDVLPLLRGLPCRLMNLTLKDGVFTDVTLNSIGQHQPDLIYLDMSFCNRITHGGVRRLIRQCRRLSFIKLSYCGFRMNDFPSAGPHCTGVVATVDNTYIALDYLDVQAIDTIRQWDLF
jgi:hypothetical protein